MEGVVGVGEVGGGGGCGVVSPPDVIGGALALDLWESGALIAIATVWVCAPPPTLISTTASSRSLLSHGRNGCRSCSRSLLGSTSTVIAEPSGGGTWDAWVGGWGVLTTHRRNTSQTAHLVGVLARVKSLHRIIRVRYHDNSSAPPTQSSLTLDGSSSPYGGLSLNRSPLAPTSSSVKGLKSSDPARARAVTTCSVREREGGRERQGGEGGCGGAKEAGCGGGKKGGGGGVGSEDVEGGGGASSTPLGRPQRRVCWGCRRSSQ